MERLANVYINEAKTDDTLLQAAYREPSITAYNRLEPRPRTENFERSLRAEVRDGLWMLTRQWQMGELEAEDAGSAIDARLLTKQIHVDRIALDGKNGRPYDESIPLEAFVEREPVPFTYALEAQIGQYFLKLHGAALRLKYRDQYLGAYGMASGREADFRGQLDGLNLYVGTQARVLDGQKLLGELGSGAFFTTITIDDAAELGALQKIAQQVLAWFARQYTQPSAGSPSAWHPRSLDYQFAVAAPDGQRQVVLQASQYHQGRLDWYAFDDAARRTLSTDEGHPAPAPPAETVISFIPTPAAFKGIPNPRFWEMEDRQIDFGKLNAKTTDQLMLLFAEFGLVFGNDWFVIPYKMPVNTLCEVKGLVITDVFGDRTLIRAADDDPDAGWKQKWSMFNLSVAGNMDLYDRHFFLPATLVSTLESAPVEEVNLVRDEMANMVWGVEDVIPDATGKGIDGHEAADQTGVAPPPIADSPAAIRYLLGTAVPENWIPFLPVHKPGSQQSIEFQRAAMPKLGNPPKDAIKAKGVLLTEVSSPYFINEEEIPYAGTIVTRTYQRTRWYDGRTYLWLGRRRETGRGEGNSRLRFDQIEPIKKS